MSHHSNCITWYLELEHKTVIPWDLGVFVFSIRTGKGLSSSSATHQCLGSCLGMADGGQLTLIY